MHAAKLHNLYGGFLLPERLPPEAGGQWRTVPTISAGGAGATYLSAFRDGLRRSVGLTGATWKSSAFAEPLIRPLYYLASKIWITAA
jgi:hypothetical protein